jgi:hypothetical protein
MKQKRVQHYRTCYCEVCRRPFKASRSNAKTCSPACRKKRSRAGEKQRSKDVAGVTLKQLEMLLRKHGG